MGAGEREKGEEGVEAGSVSRSVFAPLLTMDLLLILAFSTDTTSRSVSPFGFGDDQLVYASPSPQLYSVSLDPNQTYFLAWQLELIPHWTLLAVQRYGEDGGPATRDVELTETELDWCVTFSLLSS